MGNDTETYPDWLCHSPEGKPEDHVAEGGGEGIGKDLECH